MAASRGRLRGRRLHPATDPNWRPCNYKYVGADLAEIHRTCVPVSDQAALDYIEWVERTFDTEVKYIQVRRPDQQWETLDWEEVEDEPEAGTAGEPGALDQG